ncbi:hypothetical protein V5O48_012987 [Marasmius crinis-equi]|uniref:DUF6534 domain-containing protein n=1 Tax=Marasmius crinis-equi TaxID=585013 RepID=A0ABR3F1H3_9AGAR
MIGPIDKSLGGLLAGTWVNSYFFMIELIMCYRYFTRCRNDPIWLKLVVVLTLAVDLTSTINHYACVYLYTITHWGDEEYVKSQYWPIPVYLVTTGASAWIVQHFLIFRFWLLSKNKFITPMLILASMTAFAGSIATAVIIVHNPTYEQRNAVTVPVTIWLVSSAVSDVSIAVILIYTLQRIKTSMRKTKNLIRRLTTLAIQTGSPGSVVATMALIVYLNDPENNISVGIAFSLGRVVALQLHNLISRAHVRKVGAQTVLSGATTAPDSTLHFAGLGDTFLRGFETDPVDTVSGIHVNQTVVRADDHKHGTLELPTDEQELHDIKSSIHTSSHQNDDSVGSAV